MEDPAIINLTIEKGRDFLLLLPIEDNDGIPFDPTGWQVRSQIRERQDRGSPLIAELQASFVETFDGPTRARTEIRLFLADSATAAPRADAGAYDIKLTSPSGLDESYVVGAAEFVGRATA